MQDPVSEEVREYQFGNCRIDVRSREFRRDGEHVAIEPKAFDLLVYLIRNRDRAIGKSELQDRIWPNVIVTEGALTRCIMKVRRAVGDDAGAIVTVHGHGYRFNAELTTTPGSDARHAEPASGGKPSLVVLPFVNLSNNPEQEYFSDGITEDIITEVSRFRSLFVILSY